MIAVPFQESPALLRHLHRVNREHGPVVEVQRGDLEHVARAIRTQVEATNRGFGIDVVAVPAGADVDPDTTHTNIVVHK